MMQIQNKSFRLSDLYCAAFLSLSGLKFSLEKKENKVLFCFEPLPDLYKALQAFNEGGAQVDVSAFTQEIKKLRAQMYELKGIRHNNGAN